MATQTIALRCKNMELALQVTEHGAYIEGGTVNGLQVVQAPLAQVRVKRLSDGREFAFDSESGFEKSAVSLHKNHTKITLFNPLDGRLDDFCLVFHIKTVDDRIEWSTSVLNDNHGYSVLTADYPTLTLCGSHLDAFVPLFCGMEEKDVIENEYYFRDSYPYGCKFTMQYFAFYKQGKGVYAAIHDRDGSFKYFTVKTDKAASTCTFETRYLAVGMGNGANGFVLPGKLVWQAMDGDWYDASNIYRDFVRKEAVWIPEVDENGRFDTPQWFKEIPFWIMDWMPNGKGKNDPVPTSIRPRDGEVIPPDAWYEKPIRLQKELGAPIGYHLYNWHMIPFNNDFPHFFPAQEEAYEGVRKLTENNVHVMPYINGRLWDMHDRLDEDYLFSKVAKKWTAKSPYDGTIFTESYESKERNGDTVQLATMCPSSGVWKTQLSGVLDKLVNDLKVPAIYIDQIAAAPPQPCVDPAHNHLPGGGSWWNESYEKMLTRFQSEVGDDVALTTECNAEPFMKEMDGYLSWLWLQTNDVPAFTRVYSGLVVFFGRNSNGKKKSDTMFFKHSQAQSLVYGQQMGWINADVVEDPARLAFLKKLVELRVAHTRFFNSGDMLRPPVVTCDKEDLLVEPALEYKGPQVIHHVVSGGWRLWDGTDTRLFAINLADEPTHAVLRIDAREYADVPCTAVRMGSGQVLSVKEEGKERVVELLIEPNNYVVL